MTDTGQIPGEGLPENAGGQPEAPQYAAPSAPAGAGQSEQPGIPGGFPESGGYPVAEPVEPWPGQDDLLFPDPQQPWGESGQLVGGVPDYQESLAPEGQQPHTVHPGYEPAPRPGYGQPGYEQLAAYQQNAPQGLELAPDPGPQEAPVAPDGPGQSGGTGQSAAPAEAQPETGRFPSGQQPTPAQHNRPKERSAARPTPVRRPLHLGPPVPDASSGGVVRSLADRGPAGSPARHLGPPTGGLEYLDVSPGEPAGDTGPVEQPEPSGPEPDAGAQPSSVEPQPPTGSGAVTGPDPVAGATAYGHDPAAMLPGPQLGEIPPYVAPGAAEPASQQQAAPFVEEPAPDPVMLPAQNVGQLPPDTGAVPAPQQPEAWIPAQHTDGSHWPGGVPVAPDATQGPAVPPSEAPMTADAETATDPEAAVAETAVVQGAVPESGVPDPVAQGPVAAESVVPESVVPGKAAPGPDVPEAAAPGQGAPPPAAEQPSQPLPAEPNSGGQAAPTPEMVVPGAADTTTGTATGSTVEAAPAEVVAEQVAPPTAEEPGAVSDTADPAGPAAAGAPTAADSSPAPEADPAESGVVQQEEPVVATGTAADAGPDDAPTSPSAEAQAAQVEPPAPLARSAEEGEQGAEAGTEEGTAPSGASPQAAPGAAAAPEQSAETAAQPAGTEEASAEPAPAEARAEPAEEEHEAGPAVGEPTPQAGTEPRGAETAAEGTEFAAPAATTGSEVDQEVGEDGPGEVEQAASTPETEQPAAGVEPREASGDQAEQERSEPAASDAPESPEEAATGFAEAERAAVLRVMRERRDISSGFRSDPVPHDVLLRVLEAAHTAPSVGHSQPWDFVVIRSAETRQAVHELVSRQREEYARSLPKGRAKQFKELKVEAVLETPVNIVVTADPTRGGRHTMDRHTQPKTAPYSSALAVENLWLAARAEGLGVGWVSFFDERELVRLLGLPEHLEIVGYLCLGYVDEFPEEPELLQTGWSKRRPLSWVVHEETYGRRALPGEGPHDLLRETLQGIRPLDAKALGEAWERQKRMTKPAGSLGMLEIISAQLSGLSRQCPPPIPEPAAVAVFAGDHGVHAQGVTAWPQEVTAQMVANFLAGGAVCNAFAGQVGAEVCVVDVGVAADLPATPGLMPRKVRPGTDDFTAGPALSRQDVLRAVEVGIETARDLVAAGNKALVSGEMGIANTTASAALVSVYTGQPPAEVTGRGAGVNDETHARKVDVVRRGLELHQPDPADPIGVLAAFGGLEHAALVGLVLGGASLRTPVILDGVTAGAAALVARAMAPEALAACIAGHRSSEPGHVAALTKLGLRPLVDLDLRLGEGTGALLALPVVQSAARAMHEVATFDSAGITGKA
ncbi:nicotinate-nucleotide--dimethylbenzimidazole phosphoribosyltransferase [Streptomyces sp. TP-A0874]|uniref:nicotinate-nucleotide--dimethylbenzimidazole phosphoribosyltransferase n=1 Tax=Streptomyces sp. TP-A0874 TaxID=549819 RepID=UPI000852DB7C|nr:nicotinate-nucleotide--dimethylbenzimidazole phosphoribosyltransferase [Streptomyces sp. TP-A0874]